MKLGIDLDDVIAVCAVPYLRKFAQEFGVELPDEREIGWHLLASLDERVSPRSARPRARARANASVIAASAMPSTTAIGSSPGSSGSTKYATTLPQTTRSAAKSQIMPRRCRGAG